MCDVCTSLNRSPYPQVVAKLCGEHLLELGPAQCVFVTLVSRVLVEGLDHELHGVLQGGGVLWVGQRHSGKGQKEEMKVGKRRAENPRQDSCKKPASQSMHPFPARKCLNCLFLIGWQTDRCNATSRLTWNWSSLLCQSLKPCTVSSSGVFPPPASGPDKILLQINWSSICLLPCPIERTSGSQGILSSRTCEPADKSETLSWSISPTSAGDVTRTYRGNPIALLL